MQDYNYIPERINYYCRLNGLSVYGLAQESGISYNTLYGIMKGKVLPSIFTLDLICQNLNTTLSEFFRGEQPEEEKSITALKDSLNSYQMELVNTYICGLMGIVPENKGGVKA